MDTLLYTLTLSIYNTQTHTRSEEKCGMSQTAELLLQCFVDFGLMIAVAVLLRFCNPEKKNHMFVQSLMVDNLFSDFLVLTFVYL